jgi:hypothetical protein
METEKKGERGGKIRTCVDWIRPVSDWLIADLASPPVLAFFAEGMVGRSLIGREDLQCSLVDVKVG